MNLFSCDKFLPWIKLRGLCKACLTAWTWDLLSSGKFGAENCLGTWVRNKTSSTVWPEIIKLSRVRYLHFFFAIHSSNSKWIVSKYLRKYTTRTCKYCKCYIQTRVSVRITCEQLVLLFPNLADFPHCIVHIYNYLLIGADVWNFLYDSCFRSRYILKVEKKK